MRIVNVLSIVTTIQFWLVVESSVTWYTASKEIVFGKDVVLTCYTGHMTLKAKDCPVRQWSGGSTRKGLMYNSYSSNEEKYEEEANLTTSQFSLKIKNFAESDVNVIYTCSCGFSTFTQKLALNNTHFHYLPTAFNITVDTKNNSVKVKIECNKVYPSPICSVNIGNRLVFEDKLPASKTNGLFYSLKFEIEFALSAADCNKIPVVKCEFCKKCAEMKLIEYPGKQTPECAVDTQQVNSYAPNTTHVSFENQTSRHFTKETYFVVLSILVPILVVFVLMFWLYRNCPPCKDTATTNKLKKHLMFKNRET